MRGEQWARGNQEPVLRHPGIRARLRRRGNEVHIKQRAHLPATHHENRPPTVSSNHDRVTSLMNVSSPRAPRDNPLIPRSANVESTMNIALSIERHLWIIDRCIADVIVDPRLLFAYGLVSTRSLKVDYLISCIESEMALGVHGNTYRDVVRGKFGSVSVRSLIFFELGRLSSSLV